MTEKQIVVGTIIGILFALFACWGMWYRARLKRSSQAWKNEYKQDFHCTDLDELYFKDEL